MCARQPLPSAVAKSVVPANSQPCMRLTCVKGWPMFVCGGMGSALSQHRGTGLLLLRCHQLGTTGLRHRVSILL